MRNALRKMEGGKEAGAGRSLWLKRIINVSLSVATVKEDRRDLRFVSFYNGKWKKEGCPYYRETNLLIIPGKVCGRVITERMVTSTEN